MATANASKLAVHFGRLRTIAMIERYARLERRDLRAAVQAVTL